MRSLLLCALLALPSSAQSQTAIAMLQGTSISADWGEVAKCAAKPYPAMDETSGRSRQMFEHYFHQIDGCRTMLIAHHQGWIDAGRAAAEDPHQPEPINREGDFKGKLDCDYSKIDKNGMGTVNCVVNY